MVKTVGFMLFVAAGIGIGMLIGVSDNLTDQYQWAVAIAPIGIMLIVVLYATILKRWQWGVYALIAYMPFSGLPGILLYPLIGSGWPTLFKDFLFVIPAYLSFTLWYINERKHVHLIFPGAKPTVTLMALFAGLVVLQCFNPQLVNLKVALIGLKVWLFYMPLFVLGSLLSKC